MDFIRLIFPIVLFLTPKYRDFFISRFYQKDWLVRQIIILAIKWKFLKSDCTDIAQDITAYSKLAKNRVPRHALVPKQGALGMPCAQHLRTVPPTLLVGIVYIIVGVVAVVMYMYFEV